MSAPEVSCTVYAKDYCTWPKKCQDIYPYNGAPCESYVCFSFDSHATQIVHLCRCVGLHVSTKSAYL